MSHAFLLRLNRTFVFAPDLFHLFFRVSIQCNISRSFFHRCSGPLVMSASSLSDGLSFLVLITSSSLPRHLCPIIAFSLSPFRHLCIMIISTFIIPYSFHVLMSETRALYYPFKTASQVPTNGDSIPYSVTACDHFATLRPFKPSGPVEDREEECQEQGETCQGDEGCK